MPITGAELLVRSADAPGTPPETLVLTAARAGFEYLSFRIVTLPAGGSYEGETGDSELGLVLFGGRCTVRSSEGEWRDFGGRATVFDGIAFTLYLPPGARYTVESPGGCDFALCFCRATERHPARLITPAEVDIEIRGGGNATRQINHLLKPEFPADRLLLVEVYTPGGNWSSYPPHKHDEHKPPGEVDLEEIYYYRIDRPEGYAVQKVYTADRRLDATLTVRDGELVIVPEGYHPVVAAHGYNVYYLNALAGSARSMAASDDPDYAWVRRQWKDRDPRLPLVGR